MTRLVAVQIADGYSPEARALALLLRHAAAAGCTARVLLQAGPREAAEVVPSGTNGRSKLFDGASPSASAELEWRATGPASEPDPALQFADDAAGGAVGNAVVAMDFGWRPPETLRVPGDRMRARLRFVASLPRALMVAREAAAEAVYSGQHSWDLYAATYLARRLRLAQVVHLHHATGDWLKRPLAARLRRARLVIASSQWVREQAVRAGAVDARVAVVRDPVELTPPATEEARQAAGRWVRAQYAVPEGAPLVFGILAPGDGEPDPAALGGFREAAGRTGAYLLTSRAADSERFRAAAAGSGVGERVRAAKALSDASRELAAADVALGLSRPAPYGPELLQACAAGLPAVRTAGAGAEEIVEDGRSGFLTPPGDAAAIGERLTELLASEPLRRAMGQAARERAASEFAPERAGAEFAAAIARAMQSAPGGAGPQAAP